MVTIDDNTLAQLGLVNLSEKEAQDAKAKIAGRFEDRLGDELINRLNDEQLNEFEQYVVSVDTQGGLQWLEQHVPDYQDVVGQVFTQLMGEIKTGGLAVLNSAPTE